MAVAEKQNAYMMDRKRLYVDGHEVKMGVAGLGFDPATVEVSRAVYGDIDPVQIFRYTGGAQSLDILDDANLKALRYVLAGFDPGSGTTGATEARRLRSPRAVHAWTVTLNEKGDGHDDGSELITNWRISFGAAKGNPDGEAVRTIAGNADLAIELLDGSQYTSKRVGLVSGNTMLGSWTTPNPLILADYEDRYAAYLEIQKNTGRDFTFAEIEVDTTNVTASGNGGQVSVAHADVVNGIDGGAEYAWVIFAHAAATIVTPDSRYGYT